MNKNELRLYKPSRGGHAPGHIREAFIEGVDQSFVSEFTLDSEIEGQEGLTVRQAIGLVWNCTDIMPSTECSTLELPIGSTYAQGARRLKMLYETEWPRLEGLMMKRHLKVPTT